MTEVISVKFKNRGKVYFFDPHGIAVRTGEKVVVETSRGLELAECVEPLRAMQACYKMRFAETEYENISVDYPRHLDEVIAEIRRLGLDKTIED